MLIGSKCKKESLKTKMPLDVIQFVDELEEMIELTSLRTVGSLRIGALGVLFTPCVKKMEILDSAIYLINCN